MIASMIASICGVGLKYKFRTIAGLGQLVLSDKTPREFKERVGIIDSISNREKPGKV